MCKKAAVSQNKSLNPNPKSQLYISINFSIHLTIKKEMRPDTARKPRIFLCYCCLVTRILALSSLVLQRNGWWWWSGAAANRSRSSQISVPVVLIAARVHTYLCTVQRSKWIFYLIWFLLGWAATRKAFLSTPQTRPLLLGIIKSLESCSGPIVCCGFENSFYIYYTTMSESDWMCALQAEADCE